MLYDSSIRYASTHLTDALSNPLISPQTVLPERRTRDERAGKDVDDFNFGAQEEDLAVYTW